MMTGRTNDQPANLDEATKCVASDPDQSLAICEQFLSQHPDDPRGLFCRFQAWEELGEFEQALADINRVIQIDPDWVSFLARGAFFHNAGHQRKLRTSRRHVVQNGRRAGDICLLQSSRKKRDGSRMARTISLRCPPMKRLRQSLRQKA